MEELKKLYKDTQYKAVKYRILYFYGRCLYELGDYKKAIKSFVVLKGTDFYRKYKSEIDFMIKRAASRS